MSLTPLLYKVFILFLSTFPHQSLNEEIVSRKKQVDQAVKNGQALLKQTTGKVQPLTLDTTTNLPSLILDQLSPSPHLTISH